MSFPTYEFAVFGLIALTVFWALRGRWQQQKIAMLLASYYAYARFDFRLLALIIASSLLNFALGEMIVRTQGDRGRKAWLTLGLVTNLGFLGWFKYYDFFRRGIEGMSEALGLSSHLPILEVFIPLGISFYTFKSMAYLIDMHRGTAVRAPSPIDYLLFIAFFPALVAGPICRSRDLMPQIAMGPPEEVPNVSEAMTLIGSGMFKKLIISTMLSTRIVEDPFVRPEEFGWFTLLVAAFAYSIQLYCDFSGYTDMARGTALLCGFKIPENFKSPYAATSPGEFWQRWHITFSSWLKDYVYIPLGGSRGSKPRTSFNLFFTFSLSGLWHGASWGYIIWGVLHGIALVVQKLWREFRRGHGIEPKKMKSPMSYEVVGWFLTFNFVVFSRVPFRAPDLETAGLYLSRMLTFKSGESRVDAVVVLAIAIGLAINFIGLPLRHLTLELHRKIPTVVRPAVWAAAALFLLALKPSDVAPFIYFQF